MAMDWDKWRIRMNRGGRVRCESGWRLDRRWSAEYLRDFDLWFVWAGAGTMTLADGRTIALRPGVALWMRPGGLYLAEQDPDQRLGVSYQHFDLLDKHGVCVLSPHGLPGEVHDVADVPHMDGAMRRISDLLQLASPRRHAAAAALLKALLMDLSLTGGSGSPPAQSPATRRHAAIVAELSGLIRESPGDAPTLRELAAKARCSTDHLARLFRRATGQSPQQFIVQARIDRAKLLLRETDMTVTRIADALGYGDVFHFSRQFTLKAGITPTAFRAGR